MSQQKNTTSSGRRMARIATIILIAAVMIAVAFYFVKVRNTDDAKTTSTSKTAQSDYSEGEERNTDGQSTGNDQGGAVDNNGQASTPGSGGSVSSDDNVLTVNGIAANTIIKTGSELQGMASGGVSQVRFRIIDDEVGLLGQGSLNVVNGVFSGRLSFAAKSSSGRVDVYVLDAAGTEQSNIEIPVKFE